MLLDPGKECSKRTYRENGNSVSCIQILYFLYNPQKFLLILSSRNISYETSM
jgi:hypothetical protein